MIADDWLTLDEFLGYAEVLLVPFSIVYLLIALWRGGRIRTVRSTVFALVLAVTVAQPFGIRGVPISPAEFNAGEPERADAESIHSVSVLGVPLIAFRPYTREIRYLNGESGYPSDWLKLRSWLWPGLLTNGAKIERLCGNEFQPCWSPEAPHGYGDPRNLELVNDDGEWRYRILRSEGKPPAYPPRADDGIYGYHGYYQLTVGIVSVAGLIYWGLAAILFLGIAYRHAWRKPGSDSVVGPA